MVWSWPGCAVCDAAFFKNKDVVVVGCGNTAVEDALYLTRHVRSVTLVHRRDRLRAEKVMQDRLFANPKVTVRWNTVVDEILGGGAPRKVTGIRLRETGTGASEDLPIDGVFVAIGHAPSTAVFADHLPTDSYGYIQKDPDSN